MHGNNDMFKQKADMFSEHLRDGDMVSKRGDMVRPNVILKSRISECGTLPGLLI